MNSEQMDRAIDQAVSDCINGLTDIARQMVKPLYSLSKWFAEIGSNAAGAGKKCPPQEVYRRWTAEVFFMLEEETANCLADLFQKCYEQGYAAGKGTDQSHNTASALERWI